MTASKGGKVGNTKTSTFSQEFSEVGSFDELSFGKGAVYKRMENGEEYYTVPYGKSNDGTPCVLSKEGNLFKPGVYPLGEGGDTSAPTAVNFQRAINNSEVKEIKYYKYVETN